MLKLSVNGHQPDSLFYDQIVPVDLTWDGQKAQITLQASIHGQGVDETAVEIPIFEAEFMMEKGSRTHDIHLKFVNQSLCKVSVVFAAVAVIYQDPPKQNNILTSFEVMPEPIFQISPMDLVSGAEPTAKTTTQLGQEIDRAQLTASLVPYMEMTVACARPGADKDRFICQFDFATFDDPVQIHSMEFTVQQGKAVPLIPLQLPLTICARNVSAITLCLETLLASPSCKSQVEMNCTCAGKTIKTNWTTRINVADVSGPTPKLPSLPHTSPLPNSRSSALSTHSVLSASSQTAIYPMSSSASLTSHSTRKTLSGVSIYITGPKKVKLGQEFEWDVLFVNKSNRTRKLALTFHTKEQLPQAPQSLARHEERALVSDAFTLRKRIQVYKNGLGQSTGIIPLVPSLRIGQLGAYACFNATVKLLAAERGLQSVIGSTVQDFTTGEVHETGELLSVIVE